ncbi:hypothetical protein ES705_51184 [subsurface metagenome]
MLGWQVKWLLTDHFLGELRLFLEANHSIGNLHLTQVYLHQSAASTASSLNNTQIFDFFSLSIIRGGGRLGVGGAVSQVKLGDQIGFPLMEVNSARMYLKKGNTGLYGLQ